MWCICDVYTTSLVASLAPGDLPLWYYYGFEHGTRVVLFFWTCPINFMPLFWPVMLYEYVNYSVPWYLSSCVVILLVFLDKHHGSVMVLWMWYDNCMVFFWSTLKQHANIVVYESYNHLPWYISKYLCIIMVLWFFGNKPWWCHGFWICAPY